VTHAKTAALIKAMFVTMTVSPLSIPPPIPLALSQWPVIKEQNYIVVSVQVFTKKTELNVDFVQQRDSARSLAQPDLGFCTLQQWASPA